MSKKKPTTQVDASSCLRILLAQELEKAERELQRLGRRKDAWRCIEVISADEEIEFSAREFAEPGPHEYSVIPLGWLGGGNLEALLRNHEIHVENAKITKSPNTAERLPRDPNERAIHHLVWLKVHSATATALGPRQSTTRPAVGKVTRRTSRKEKLLGMSFVQTTPAWRHAMRAALAHAAMCEIESPLATFLVGISLGQSYLAEVYVRQKLLDVGERAVIDAHVEAGRKRHNPNISGAANRTATAKKPFIAKALCLQKRWGDHPDKIAGALHSDKNLQAHAERSRGKPYTLAALRKIVRSAICPRKVILSS